MESTLVCLNVPSRNNCVIAVDYSDGVKPGMVGSKWVECKGTLAVIEEEISKIEKSFDKLIELFTTGNSMKEECMNLVHTTVSLKKEYIIFCYANEADPEKLAPEVEQRITGAVNGFVDFRKLIFNVAASETIETSQPNFEGLRQFIETHRRVLEDLKEIK
uniref:Trafficking protein particle complex subunit n=2 Tax=Caenorhabditis tropicalis TaxID=1561998 RepID=A0A1I7UQD5_9PELO